MMSWLSTIQMMMITHPDLDLRLVEVRAAHLEDVHVDAVLDVDEEEDRVRAYPQIDLAHLSGKSQTGRTGTVTMETALL